MSETFSRDFYGPQAPLFRILNQPLPNVDCDCLFIRPQIVDKPGLSEKAKKFVVEWADACKYQIDLKYHMMGGGPDAQKVRWSFESAIKYIIICATHLADQDDNVDFKKELSDFVKDVFIQSLIDQLENLKVNTSEITFNIIRIEKQCSAL